MDGKVKQQLERDLEKLERDFLDVVNKIEKQSDKGPIKRDIEHSRNIIYREIKNLRKIIGSTSDDPVWVDRK